MLDFVHHQAYRQQLCNQANLAQLQSSHYLVLCE